MVVMNPQIPARTSAFAISFTFRLPPVWAKNQRGYNPFSTHKLKMRLDHLPYLEHQMTKMVPIPLSRPLLHPKRRCRLGQHEQAYVKLQKQSARLMV
jgi:hypothetical protein